jgi:prefoldin beta subunit
MADKDLNKKIEELQLIETHLRNFLAQRQTLQMELNEIENAYEEVEKGKGDMYKIVAGVMIKSDKEELKKELGEKKKLIKARIESIEKQEKILDKESNDLRKDINDRVGKEKD